MHWTVNVEGGPARVYHASVAVGGVIFTFGGRYCGSKRVQDKMEVHVLNTETLQSSVVPVTEGEGPPNLLGHTAVVYEDKIYVWGGYHLWPFNHVGPSRLWCFDPAQRCWSEEPTAGEVPAPRIHHAACVVDGRMLVIGGCERRFGFPMRVVHALDMRCRPMYWRAYTATDNAPHAGMYRAAVSTTPRDGSSPRSGCAQICLFGGATSRSLFPTGQEERGLEPFVRVAMGQLYGWRVTHLDAATCEWLPGTAGTSHPALAGSAGFVHGGLLYTTASAGAPDADVGVLTRRATDDTELEEVRPAGVRHSTRCMGTCVVVDDRVFFVGGESPRATEATRPQGIRDSEDEAVSWQNEKYDRLANHYGAVQVLDFSPNLRAMCMAVIVKFNLRTDYLPNILRKDLDLCYPRQPTNLLLS